jgi:hypothetical protein
MSESRFFDLKHTSLRISEYVLDNERIRRILDLFELPLDPGPVITDFQPWTGYAGTLMIIVGSNFSLEREENLVQVGGRPALVIAAEANRLTVITHHETQTGDVEVTVNGDMAVGPRPFEVLGWPKPGSGEDGPPFSYAGAGPTDEPSAGTVPPTGTARILVVTCNPTDLVPPDPAAARQDVIDTFDDVTTFYDQVSYGVLNVQVDVTNYVSLLNDANYYHRANGDPGYPNIDSDVLDQLMAECAQGAMDQGFVLNDYVVLVASVWMPGLTVRAWGGWSRDNFAYDDGAGTNINITTDEPLGLIAQRHDADWGRAAHEFAHNLIDGGLVLGEDVYDSDLIDPSEATAQNFEMMGNHDSHPMFSGFLMHQLGWYDAANILELEWDRNPFSQEYDLIAHGMAEDMMPNQYHLIRIRVSEGLYYFIEVRQRPDTAGGDPQVFDENIPLPMGGAPDGGVIVTKVITDELNNNHQTRLITLLQAQDRVMITGEEAVDPLRTLRIRVVNDNVQARPRVCRVEVEWAQEIVDDPSGDFDLRIEPWGPGAETIDIWVDRMPFGTFDNTDPAGNPVGNGDAPRPLEINRFEALIRNDGVADATDVMVSHYVISPPGVGDNGTWTPIDTNIIANIPNNGTTVSRVNWVPLVGEHTCLKVAISQQLGEVSGGNNSAQENVFEFEPAASSTPEPVVMTVAVRNPLKERAMILISLEGAPRDYFVYFPHRWLWLEPLGERKLDLIIVPMIDIQDMRYKLARIRLYGQVPRVYRELLDITGVPASWMAPIGGILANVRPKLRGDVWIDDDVKVDENQGQGQVTVHGKVKPAIEGQKVTVYVTQPDQDKKALDAYSDPRGNFQATFQMGRPRRPYLKDKVQPIYLSGQPGYYGIQAHILAASQLAPADSNVVWIKIGKAEDSSQQEKKQYRQEIKKKKG